MELAIPANQRAELKETKEIAKYLNLAKELKRLSNMKVTVIPILVRVLGMILNDLEKRLEELEIRGRTKTIQATTLLRLARILSKVLEIRRYLLSLKLQ